MIFIPFNPFCPLYPFEILLDFCINIAEKEIMLSPVTVQQIVDKFGKPIRYPLDCVALSVMIENETGERISTNTLKRLLGFIDETREPRLYTLDTIAKYLGFDNWDVYLMSINKSGNSEFGKIEEINVADLQVNDKIEFHYSPDRMVTVQYLGTTLFEVIKAVNSKLIVGDQFEVKQFFINYPLYINDVIRDGNHLGSFTAGKVSGITMLKKLTD